MSFNQSRSDKSHNQYRKSGRSGSFNQQRGSSGTNVKGGGGGPAPSSRITSGFSQPSNWCFSRSNNPHGGPSRVNPPPVNSAESNSASAGRTIPNGAHLQQSPASDAPVTNAAAKSYEPSSVQKSTRVVPKASTPRPTTMNSDTAAPTTPTKASGDSSESFAVQFGSISPFFMNRSSIPARTSSDPPNLDEQKRDQAHHDSFRPVPSVPTPPKQLPPRNDGGVIAQSNAGEAHSVSKLKKEEQASVLAPSSQVQKPSVLMTGISMAMPYHHQSQAPVQFDGPTPQIQSQGMPAASLQMPMAMPLPTGNVPQVQQQVFVPGLQPLPIHPQGIMHQGQNLSFTPQMGPQLPHQLGNMGINMSPQYSLQQGGKCAGPHKTTAVKITHGEKHEELRLDFDKKADSDSDGVTSGAMSYPNVPSQAQPVQSFAASHPLNFFPSSTYSSGCLFLPPSSVPLSSSHMTPGGERWQRATNFQQRGLIPSPQTPLQVMHKAEKKYEVGKVTDMEQAKQRQLKAILKKLTPQNYEKLVEQVKAVNIDNAVTLTGVISQIFEKALVEPFFCEMYANFCLHLAFELPDFSEDNEKITFKRLLLNKCQEEFERGEREQEEANKHDEGDVKQTDGEREKKRVEARRRMLGNIRLIGELYKKKMLTERIMHECIKKLLGSYQDPNEDDIEALCELMSTIGETIDHPKAKEHMDAYFERMKSLSNMNLSSRVRFMLKDAIDLRKNKWQLKRKVEGPKKIEEVHRDAAQERQAQSGRLGHGPGNKSSRRMPMELCPIEPSIFSPPNSPMGMRGLSAQVRSGGSKDVCNNDRLSYEARNLSVPFPLRPLGDDSITLGPQGGLAIGMSFRGPAVIPNSAVPDVLPVSTGSRRMTFGLNGYGNSSECVLYSGREDLMPRYSTDRFGGTTAHDQSAVQDCNINYGNRELRNAGRVLERPVATLPPGVQGSGVSENASSEMVWPEGRLQDMSMAAIKEYYSARDVKEVALCVKDLNSPSYHPSMISLWVTDSFERKDTEKYLLVKLLVSLTQNGTLSQAQLIHGFESVLSGLEDAVNDAPRAPEFVGRIFARVVIENVLSLKEIGQLLHEGGEEPGQLLEIGLAADVLGSTLEAIKMEKGDAVE